MKNEKTGKRVAAIAGRVLGAIEFHKKNATRGQRVWILAKDELFGVVPHKLCTVADLKTLAASALTQTPDKKTRAK